MKGGSMICMFKHLDLNVSDWDWLQKYVPKPNGFLCPLDVLFLKLLCCGFFKENNLVLVHGCPINLRRLSLDIYLQNNTFKVIRYVLKAQQNRAFAITFDNNQKCYSPNMIPFCFSGH